MISNFLSVQFRNADGRDELTPRTIERILFRLSERTRGIAELHLRLKHPDRGPRPSR